MEHSRLQACLNQASLNGAFQATSLPEPGSVGHCNLHEVATLAYFLVCSQGVWESHCALKVQAHTSMASPAPTISLALALVALALALLLAIAAWQQRQY